MKLLLFSLLLPCAWCYCGTTNIPEVTNGPDSPSQSQIWLANLLQWRETTLKQNNYTGSYYSLPGISWAQQSFVQPQVPIPLSDLQVMIHDRYLYDPSSQKYTVKWLDVGSSQGVSAFGRFWEEIWWNRLRFAVALLSKYWGG